MEERRADRTSLAGTVGIARHNLADVGFDDVVCLAVMARLSLFAPQRNAVGGSESILGRHATGRSSVSQDISEMPRIAVLCFPAQISSGLQASCLSEPCRRVFGVRGMQEAQVFGRGSEVASLENSSPTT
jgi:hypothetical protein